MFRARFKLLDDVFFKDGNFVGKLTVVGLKRRTLLIGQRG
jgi:hypothetical protein